MVAAIFAGAGLATQAFAAGAGNEFLAGLLGRLGPGGQSFACFSRQYGDAHLSAHARHQIGN
jgi:hypothetical protein